MSDPTAPSSLPPEPNPAPGAGAPPLPPQPAVAGSFSTASGTSTTGLASNVAAGLACIFSIVGGIVFLILEKKDQFVRFYAMQSLIVGGASICFSIALNIVSFILVHLPVVGRLIALLLAFVGMIVGLGFFALWIVMIVKAFTSKEWEVPYVGKIAREQLARMAASEGTPPTPSAPTAS